MRIAAFGFRSFPPREGSAGADKFALELLPRLAALGHHVVAYNRIYPGTTPIANSAEGVQIKNVKTVRFAGFDTLIHSALVTIDIIVHNTADVIHIQNGGNSPFAFILRLFGKRTYLSQDGLDWERKKWPWYAKLYLFFSSYVSAFVHNSVIFDNIFARDYFEERFSKKFDFIPFGADVVYDVGAESVLDRLGLKKSSYFLFVGRFIPDKGIHCLITAFERLNTTKKLVLVGGSPNGSQYEESLRTTPDKRILFAGFVYGGETHALMKNCFAYVQPSFIEGLSPVLLEAAYLGAPVVCSDIPQNRYGLKEHASYFPPGDIDALHQELEDALRFPDQMEKRSSAARRHVQESFSWNSVVSQHVAIFERDDPMSQER